MADKAGKGMLYLTAANAVFFIAGFIISMALARILDINAFGIYGVVVSLVSTVNIIFVNGFKQIVSKFVSEEGSLSQKEKLTLFGITAGMALTLFALLYLGAGTIAFCLNDLSLIPFIQLISFLVLTYGLYSFFNGYVNGLRKFKWEAGLRALYSFLKVAFIIGFALTTLDLAYTFTGFILASVSILVAGILVYKKLDTKQKTPLKKKNPLLFLHFSIPLIMFVFVTTFLINLDLLMVKALAPIASSNTQAAFYNVASTISKLPFYAVMALSAVLLPVISHWTHRKRMDKLRFYITNVNRYSLMFLALIAASIAATSQELVALLFKPDYLPAALPLEILVFGISFYALFSILASIISGHGKPVVPMAIAAFALALDFLLNFLLIPGFGIVGAAWASTASMFLAFILLSYYVWNKFHVFCPLLSMARILAAGTAAYIFASLLPFAGYLLPLSYLSVAMAYTALLFLMGELTKKDISIFKEILF